MKALALHDLRKTYRNGHEALCGIDLEVDEGDFFALLGPNGAGKSTAIGIISSLVNKTAGQVRVFGHDLDREPGAVKSCIGLVPQEFNFNQFEPGIFDAIIQSIREPADPWMTAADFRGFVDAQQRAEEAYRDVEQWTRMSILNTACSGGFSTDRTMRDYNSDIWRLDPIVLEGVLAEPVEADAAQIAGGNDAIGVDVAPAQHAAPARNPFDLSLCHYRISRTSTTQPWIAAAATMAGDIKSVRPLGDPCRPLKLRLVAEMPTSPASSVPRPSPMHAPHPGGSSIRLIGWVG